MLQGVDEQHQLQFLCVFGLEVEVLHAFVGSLLQGFDFRHSLVGPWSVLDDDTFLILLIGGEEIRKSKEFLPRELFIDLRLHSEALNRDIIDGTDDSILILIVDQLIAEDPLALVSPKSNGVELRLEVTHPIGLHDRLLLDLQDSLEGSGQLTHVEEVMELGWGWQHELLYELPELDGG